MEPSPLFVSFSRTISIAGVSLPRIELSAFFVPPPKTLVFFEGGWLI